MCRGHWRSALSEAAQPAPSCAGRCAWRRGCRRHHQRQVVAIARAGDEDAKTVERDLILETRARREELPIDLEEQSHTPKARTFRFVRLRFGRDNFYDADIGTRTASKSICPGRCPAQRARFNRHSEATPYGWPECRTCPDILKISGNGLWTDKPTDTVKSLRMSGCPAVLPVSPDQRLLCPRTRPPIAAAPPIASVSAAGGQRLKKRRSTASRWAATFGTCSRRSRSEDAGADDEQKSARRSPLCRLKARGSEPRSASLGGSKVAPRDSSICQVTLVRSFAVCFHFREQLAAEAWIEWRRKARRGARRHWR